MGSLTWCSNLMIRTHLEERLRCHNRLHRACFKVVQVAGQDAQALLRRIITIEPEAGIGWVIIFLMESLKPARSCHIPSKAVKLSCTGRQTLTGGLCGCKHYVMDLLGWFKFTQCGIVGGSLLK